MEQPPAIEPADIDLRVTLCIELENGGMLGPHTARTPPWRFGGSFRPESVDYPSGTSGAHTKPSRSTMNASRSPWGLSAAPCRTS